MKLTILMPVYNEEATLRTILDRVLSVDVGATKEVICIDDASTDGSWAILQSYGDRIHRVKHPRNRGKGAAIRTGLASATGDYVIPQDADLEYEPADLGRLLEYAREGHHRIVYGSRRLRRDNKQYSSLAFFLGANLVTWVANALYGLRLTDEATCYKLVERHTLLSMDLQCERFEFCPEVTAKAARLGLPIPEIPIEYRPRSHEAGKKIRGWDGIEAVGTLVRYLHWKPQ